MSANGAEKAVPCGTRKVIGVDFQGRCTRLLISAVPVGRVPPHGARTPLHGERANVEDAASGDAAYNSTRPDDEGGFWAVGLDWVVEREGVIKCITVIHLILRPLRRSGLFVANGSHPAASPVEATPSALMPLLRSFGFFAVRFLQRCRPNGRHLLGADK